MKTRFIVLWLVLIAMEAFSQGGVARSAFILPRVVHSIAEDAYPMMQGSLPGYLKNDKGLLEIAKVFRDIFQKPTIVARFGDLIFDSYILLGEEISLNVGTPVKALSAGTIIATTYDEDFGQYVVISHGGNLYTVYGHLAAFAGLHKGDKVRAREPIGYAGITGLVQEPCVHVAVLKDGMYLNLLDLAPDPTLKGPSPDK